MSQVKDTPLSADKPEERQIQAEIFSAGTWNGETFTVKDLEEIARNFSLLKNQLTPPLKFGHDEKQTLIGQNDGDPSLGWVEDLQVIRDKLVATFRGVPEVVYQAIKAGRYRKVSAELYFRVRKGRRKLGKALKAVALLGADIPAVTNLKDLSAYLASSMPTEAQTRPNTTGLYASTFPTALSGSGQYRLGEYGVYTLPVEQIRLSIHKETPAMTETISESKLETQHQGRLETELAELRAYKARQEHLQTEQNDLRKKAAFRSVRESSLAFCEAEVRNGRLSPGLRDQLLVEVDRQAQYFTEGAALTVSLDWMKKFIQQQPPVLARGEMAHARLDAPAVDGENPSASLAREAMNKMTELNLDYSEAAEYVLRRNPELGRAYRDYTLNPNNGE